MAWSRVVAVYDPSDLKEEFTVAAVSLTLAQWDKFTTTLASYSVPATVQSITFTDFLNGFQPIGNAVNFGFQGLPGTGVNFGVQGYFGNGVGFEQYYVVSQAYKGTAGVPGLVYPATGTTNPPTVVWPNPEQPTYAGGANVSNYAVVLQVGGQNVSASRDFVWTLAASPSPVYVMKVSSGYTTDSPFDFFNDWDSLVPTADYTGTTFKLTVPFNGAGGGHSPLIVLVSTTPPILRPLTITGLTLSGSPQIYGF